MFDAAGAAYAACKAALDVWEAAAAGVNCHTLPATRHTSHVTYQPKRMATPRLMEAVAAVQLPPFIAKRAFDSGCKSLGYV